MSLIDITRLLAPVSAASTCGPELDYDPAFQALERSLAGQPERQYGETLIPAESPDWPRIAAAASDLLERSKDFRLAAILTRALTRTHGCAGALEGLRLTVALARRYWSDAHPLLEFDGAADPLPRSNALATLAARDGLLGDLRAIELSTRQLGPLTLGMIERIHSGRAPDADLPLQRDQLSRLLADESAAGNPGFDALASLESAVVELDGLCRELLGTEFAADFHPVLELIGVVLPQPAQPVGDAPAVSNAMPAESPRAPGEYAPEATGLAAAVKSRADVVRALDAVCAYLEHAEPANPAPLLIRRARQLIGQDFLSILRELAPDGLAQATLIAGANRPD